MRRYSINQLVHKFFYIGVHRDGLRAIFWGNTLRHFASASVGLFVPIYVYKIGFLAYGDSVISGLRTLILFLLVARVVIIFSSVFVEYVIDRIGFRWMFLISSFFLFLKYVLLGLAEERLLLLWVSAVLTGIVTTTYWISRHALFGEDQDVTNIGSSLGLLIVLSRIATIVGPILGGFIALFFGFSGLFHFGLVLVVLSAIPYFFMHHHRRHHPDGFSGLMDKIRDRKNFPIMLAWFGRGWDDELTVNFWPLYVFIVLGAVEKLGIVTSLVAIVSMVVALFAGKIYDRTHHKKEMFLSAAVVVAVLWPVKALARSFLTIFSLDSLQSTVGNFYWIPFQSQIYRFSFRRDTVAFFAFREIVFSVGIVVFLLLALLLTFTWSWNVLFLLGSIGVVVSMSIVSYRGFR